MKLRIMPKPSYSLLQDAKWKVIGGYSGHVDRLSFTQDPTFPGGSTVPIVGAGKANYKVAAFFPKHVKLGPLSELGYLWVCELYKIPER